MKIRGISATRWILMLIISFSLMGTASATSWVDLAAEEVIKRSTVIVQGKYDFSERKKGGNFIWVGYEFHVEKVYRGEVPDTIIVGIDGYDIA